MESKDLEDTTVIEQLPLKPKSENVDPDAVSDRRSDDDTATLRIIANKLPRREPPID